VLSVERYGGGGDDGMSERGPSPDGFWSEISGIADGRGVLRCDVFAVADGRGKLGNLGNLGDIDNVLILSWDIGISIWLD
jgi:hypothetical protein